MKSPRRPEFIEQNNKEDRAAQWENLGDGQKVPFGPSLIPDQNMQERKLLWPKRKGGNQP